MLGEDFSADPTNATTLLFMVAPKGADYMGWRQASLSQRQGLGHAAVRKRSIQQVCEPVESFHDAAKGTYTIFEVLKKCRRNYSLSVHPFQRMFFYERVLERLNEFPAPSFHHITKTI